ncbi:MAG TPA: hypothetical protein VLJ62_12070 [Burkholderiaceae bacterium]|nr:hypothetical protein [Burkholderiaceae bacterium]
MFARPAQFIAHTATAVVAAAAGWFAHELSPPTPATVATQPPAPLQAAVAPPASSTPLIAVASDGNVTLRVEQQPLQWVLDEIAVQAGWPDLQRRACPAAVQVAASAPATALAGPAAAAAPPLLACSESAARQVDPVRVLQAIESGTEAERFQGLMLARSADVPVTEATLKHLFETGGSERVEMAAFEAYLALRADRPDDLRAALEAAQYAPTAAIRRDAAQRLAELRELDRLNALPPLADP